MIHKVGGMETVPLFILEVRMMVTLEEMKIYLRVDYGDDDALIENLIAAAKRQCKDILRTDDDADLEHAENGKIAVMFTAAYLYEHREEADHHALNLTLRRFCLQPEGGILMDIALLNQKILVQKNEVTVDAIGNHLNEWVDFYSCYATISGESPNESTSAGTVVDNTKADFTVRWCKAVSEITPDDFRVLYADEIYNILGIDHQNYKQNP